MRLRAAAAPLALVLALLTACSAESSLEDFEALRAALDAAEGVPHRRPGGGGRRKAGGIQAHT